MREIRLVGLDKRRPAVVLTREGIVPYLSAITVAPITTTIRGLTSEVPVGPGNGLDHSSVVSCDGITTVPREHLGGIIGYFLPSQELALSRAIAAAFDLDLPIVDR